VPQYDVLIVGGGMVGATLACALRGVEARIAIIESHPPKLEWPADSIDVRVSAVTAASQQIFAVLGAWARMESYGVSPFREMHVWDAGGSGVIHFDSADIGESRLGHIIENRVMQRALLECLIDEGNVDLMSPMRIVALETGPDYAHVRLDDGTSLTARLVIAADGGQSCTRDLAGIATAGQSYDQRAVVATVQTEHPHRETAWQRFLSSGPLAFLPLRDGRCSIVWSTSPRRADELLALGEESFGTALAEAFGHQLGAIVSSGPRAAFPLHRRHALQYVRPRVALVGDAAHIIHPLAGQGVNMGLLDAAALAELLISELRRGGDIGALRVLRRYERWRKGENQRMMSTMDAIKHLFESQWAPVAWLRNTGLAVTNAADPVKHLLMRNAMGLRGDLPRLARPVCP